MILEQSYFLSFENVIFIVFWLYYVNERIAENDKGNKLNYYTFMELGEILPTMER